MNESGYDWAYPRRCSWIGSTSKGYRDRRSPKDKKTSARPIPASQPRQDMLGPRTPRMVDTIIRALAAQIAALFQHARFRPKRKVSPLQSELHAASSALTLTLPRASNAPSPFPEHIARKDQDNECTFYEFRITIESDTARRRPSAPRLVGTRFTAARRPPGV